MPRDFTLQHWIDEVGVTKVAKLMKVNSSTVRHWRCGYGLPRSKQMLKIKKLTQGKLTCDDMIETHFAGGSR